MDSVADSVLHIGKYFYPSHGGIEQFLYDLSQACDQIGIAQGILVHAATSQPVGRQDLPMAPFLAYCHRVRQLGTLGYAPISPGFGAALNQALATFKPDVLHFHLPNPSAFWALFNRKAQQLPWVIHWHADAYSPDFEPLVKFLYSGYRVLEQRLLSRADCVVVTSPPYLETSQALRRFQDKCHVIPLGLPDHRIAHTAQGIRSGAWPSDSNNLSGNPLRLLAVGRLTQYKGFDCLIEAMTATDAELIIVGEGEKHSELIQLIKNKSLENRVRLLSGVDDRSRNQLLSECDLICLPSLNRAEAFGISVLEAMAVGKPALVSNIEGSGLPWLVQDNVTGWHCPPGDSQAIARKVAQLSADRECVKQFGQAAKDRYQQYFEITQVGSKIVELYQTLS